MSATNTTTSNPDPALPASLASDSGLVSLMGGKWTSYRSQGEECVDKILKLYPNRFDDNLTHKTG